MVTYVLPYEMVTVLEYLDREGLSPFANWFGGLDATAAAKVTTLPAGWSWETFRTLRGSAQGFSNTGSISVPATESISARTAKPWSSCSAAGRRSAKIATSRLRKSGGKTIRREGLGRSEMPLTREFKETVQARIARDRKYRKELLREGVERLLAGDLDTGKAILRDYINATIGFEELSRLTRRPAKSLMRMLGPKGNPQARNLFEVIGHLQRIEGLHFELSLRAAS